MANKWDMEGTLRKLFDMQRYVRNERLDDLFLEMEKRLAINSDSNVICDELLDVWAAGDPSAKHERQIVESEDSSDEQ